MDRLIDTSVSNPVSTTSCGQHNRICQSYVKEIFCVLMNKICNRYKLALCFFCLTDWPAGLQVCCTPPCIPVALHLSFLEVPPTSSAPQFHLAPQSRSQVGFLALKHRPQLSWKGLLAQFCCCKAKQAYGSGCGLSKDLGYEWGAGGATTVHPIARGQRAGGHSGVCCFDRLKPLECG